MARLVAGDERQSALSERDRFWLGHMEALSAQGGPATACAAQHDLSIGALYEARRRLVARRAPALRVAQPGQMPHPTRAPLFTQVTLASSPPGSSVSGELRVRLSGGIVLEWNTMPSIETRCALLDRIGPPR